MSDESGKSDESEGTAIASSICEVAKMLKQQVTALDALDRGLVAGGMAVRILMRESIRRIRQRLDEMEELLARYD